MTRGMMASLLSQFFPSGSSRRDVNSRAETGGGCGGGENSDGAGRTDGIGCGVEGVGVVAIGLGADGGGMTGCGASGGVGSAASGRGALGMGISGGGGSVTGAAGPTGVVSLAGGAGAFVFWAGGERGGCVSGSSNPSLGLGQ